MLAGSWSARTGKYGGRMNVVEGLPEPDSVVGRAVDVEAGAGRRQRGEEGQALDVVPVEVGDEGVARGTARRAAGSQPKKRSPVPRSSTIGSLARPSIATQAVLPP